MAVDLSNLMATLGSVFTLMGFGFLMGATSTVPLEAASGISAMNGVLLLPANLFLANATLDLSSLRWTVLMTLFFSKIIIIAIGVILAMIFKGRSKNIWSQAGIFAFFVNKSNDIAIGYPVLEALYPEYKSYVYIFAPLQLVILNPICLIFLEFGRVANGNEPRTSNTRLVLTIIWKLLSNPVVFSSIAGIICNLAFDRQLNNYVETTLRSASKAYEATALFSIGLSLVKGQKKMRGRGLLWPLVLTFLKVVILPVIARYLAFLILGKDEVPAVYNVILILAMLPPAPTAYIIALQFKRDIDVDVIAGALVVCHIIFVPIFLAAILCMTAPSSPQLVSTFFDLNDWVVMGSFAFLTFILIIVSTIPPWRKFPFTNLWYALLALWSENLFRILESILSGPLHVNVIFHVFTAVIRIQTRLWFAYLAYQLYLLSRNRVSYAYIIMAYEKMISAVVGVVTSLVYLYLFHVRDTTPTADPLGMRQMFPLGDVEVAIELATCIITFVVIATLVTIVAMTTTNHPMPLSFAAFTPLVESSGDADVSERVVIAETQETASLITPDRVRIQVLLACFVISMMCKIVVISFEIFYSEMTLTVLTTQWLAFQFMLSALLSHLCGFAAFFVVGFQPIVMQQYHKLRDTIRGIVDGSRILGWTSVVDQRGRTFDPSQLRNETTGTIGRNQTLDDIASPLGPAQEFKKVGSTVSKLVFG